MNLGLRDFCALAICACGLIGFARGQARPGFPVYPPTPDARPSVRHPVEVSMPARLSVLRTSSRLSVSYDPASLQNVKIKVGEKMTIGLKDEFRVYPEGDARPQLFRTALEGELKETERAVVLSDPGFLKSMEILSSAHDGIPAPGRRYVVEHDVILFETDIPAQHMWSPGSGRNYRVLWEKTLKAVR